MCGNEGFRRMLDIANEILQLPLLKIDLNFYPQFCKHANHVYADFIVDE